MNWLVENTLVASAAAVLVFTLCRLFRPRPALAHVLWLLVILKLLCPPLLRIPLPFEAPALSTTPAVATVVHDAPAALDLSILFAEHATDSGVASGDAPIAGDTRPVGLTRHDLAPAVPWWAITWVGGSALFLILMLIGIRRVRRTITAGATPAPWLASEVRFLARRLDIPTPRVVVSSRVGSAFVWGLTTPTLIWPTTQSAHDIEKVRTVLAHELAHIRRRDHWTAWLEIVTTIALWWNPVLWFARARMRLQAELACDAWAVWAVPNARHAYAGALIDAVETESHAALAVPVLAARPSARRTFEKRLKMILNEDVPRRLSTWALVPVAALSLSVLSGVSFAQEHRIRKVEVTSKQDTKKVDAEALRERILRQVNRELRKSLGREFEVDSLREIDRAVQRFVREKKRNARKSHDRDRSHAHDHDSGHAHDHDTDRRKMRRGQSDKRVRVKVRKGQDIEVDRGGRKIRIRADGLDDLGSKIRDALRDVDVELKGLGGTLKKLDKLSGVGIKLESLDQLEGLGDKLKHLDKLEGLGDKLRNALKGKAGKIRARVVPHGGHDGHGDHEVEVHVLDGSDGKVRVLRRGAKGDANHDVNIWHEKSDSKKGHDGAPAQKKAKVRWRQKGKDSDARVWRDDSGGIYVLRDGDEKSEVRVLKKGDGIHVLRGLPGAKNVEVRVERGGGDQEIRVWNDGDKKTKKVEVRVLQDGDGRVRVLKGGSGKNVDVDIEGILEKLHKGHGKNVEVRVRKGGSGKNVDVDIEGILEKLHKGDGHRVFVRRGGQEGHGKNVEVRVHKDGDGRVRVLKGGAGKNVDVNVEGILRKIGVDSGKKPKTRRVRIRKGGDDADFDIEELLESLEREHEKSNGKKSDAPRKKIRVKKKIT